MMPATLAWRLTLRWATLIGGLSGLRIMSLTTVSELLYFQF